MGYTSKFGQHVKTAWKSKKAIYEDLRRENRLKKIRMPTTQTWTAPTFRKQNGQEATEWNQIMESERKEENCPYVLTGN